MARPIPFDRDREINELRAYLGPSFELERLQTWERTLDEEFERVGDEAALYRTSEAYLYNLTAFAMSETKRPYVEALAKLVGPPARLLDYGCGIGSDGLALIEAGYEVAFADFDNPSTRYLRWRLERRGLRASIYDLDSDEVPGDFDAAYAFDVIEHVEDPFGLLAEMERLAGLIAVNFLEPEPGETPLHHPLPVADLVAHAARRGLRHYRRHYGRSHFVIYMPRPARGLRHLRSRVALLRGGRLGAATRRRRRGGS